MGITTTIAVADPLPADTGLVLFPPAHTTVGNLVRSVEAGWVLRAEAAGKQKKPQTGTCLTRL